MKNLAQRWQDTWSSLELLPPPNLLVEFLHSYSEPHRFYHTLQHLGECLELLDAVAPFTARLPEIQLALWFHDAIYDPRRQDNEERSANWAIEEITQAISNEARSRRTGTPVSNLDPHLAQRIHDLVLATKHDRGVLDADAQLLVDVDLAILGAPEERFAEYELQVRQEYHWVTAADFRVGRSRILQSFLDRPTIYGTPWLAEQLELKARRNLEDSIMKML